MPKWCVLACEEYTKRLGAYSASVIEIPLAKRHKNGHSLDYKTQEGKKLFEKITPKDHVIALDVLGKSWSTPLLSEQLSQWKQSGKNLAFIIGGPDGLCQKILQRANQVWSLSELTLPHHLAKVLLLEQLYRADSMLNNHPYHRE
jgi:23S rRNA (pseudouridine1915-N3)-methyltransferase